MGKLDSGWWNLDSKFVVQISRIGFNGCSWQPMKHWLAENAELFQGWAATLGAIPGEPGPLRTRGFPSPIRGYGPTLGGAQGNYGEKGRHSGEGA